MKILSASLMAFMVFTCHASEPENNSSSAVTNSSPSSKVHSYNVGKYIVNTTKDIGGHEEDIIPSISGLDTMEDTFKIITKNARNIGLEVFPFEIVNASTKSSSEASIQLVNSAITHQLFQNSYTIKRGEEVTTGPTGLYYNGNGVITFVTVTGGSVSVDLMKGSMLWEQMAIVNNKYTSTSISTGYPGYYGSRVTCISKKKCKFVASTVIIN